MQQLSHNPTESQDDDWDRALKNPNPQHTPDVETSDAPRISVISNEESRSAEAAFSRTRRSLTDLMKAYGEKGKNIKLTGEDAAGLEDVLGQWINSSSSPYEGDDDFFARLENDLLNRLPTQNMGEGVTTPTREGTGGTAGA